MRSTVRLVAAAVVLTSLSACASWPSGATVESSKVLPMHGAMPPLAGQTLDGGELTPAAYAGRPVVVNFWSTTCPPCRRETPMLASVSRAEGPGGPVFIGVSYRDAEDAARAWLRRYDVPYANVADPTGSIASSFGVTVGLPMTFVADADGQLRYRVFGEIDRRTLEDLISRVSAPASPSPA
jgi:thiol-disulfide isomerase/thioredoxin